MTDKLNLLPTPTWNHLRVNQAPEAAALPALPEGGWTPSNTTLGPLPDGVTLAAQLYPEFETLVSGAGPALDDFVKANANFRLGLAAEAAADRPQLIEHRIDGDHPGALAHQTVYARAGSALTVIEVVRGDARDGVHASLTQVCAEAGATVTLIQLQLLGGNVRSWSAVAAQCGEGARVELYRASLGGCLTLAGSRALLEGRSAAFDCRTIYYGDGEGLLDFNDVAVHTGRETASEIHGAGVLDGQCQKTLRGTIDFTRGAVHAVGHESEDVLLLSPDVRNRTAPLILCGEEQVEGQHAATAGRLDENILYYMASRGIGEDEAKRLITLGKFAPVLDALPPDLKCEANDFIEGRLGL